MPARRRLTALAAAVGMALAAADSAAGPQEDVARWRAELTDGVAEIHKPGIPGPIALVGENAFAVVAGKFRGGVHRAVVAAATYGEGRVVAFGHDGYLSAKVAGTKDTPRLVANAVRWAAGDAKKPLVGVVDPGRIAGLLQAHGIAARPLDRRHWAAALGDVDVLVISHPDLDGDANVAPLQEFVRKGGGLVTAGLAWGWMQLNPEKSLLRDHALNRALAPMGMCFADGYVDRVLPVAESGDLDICHALRAFERLWGRKARKQATEQRIQLGAVIATAYRWLPREHISFRSRVAQSIREVKNTYVPTKESPLRAKHVGPRLRTLIDHVDKSLWPEDAAPERSAADFPGAVPEDAPRVAELVRIDLTVPGWAGTGLYAPPGQVITVRPESLHDTPIRIRIGCHSDRLWDKEEWWRHPDVSATYAFETRDGTFGRSLQPLRIASPHGGLVYVEVPAVANAKRLGVVIEDVVLAPRFVLGETSALEWRSARERSAPWAELANDKITLTVPSSLVRELEDPTELMQFWSNVLDLYAELGQRPLAKRPQRIVADRQISVGWMHAGYPIMIDLESAGQLVNLAALRDAAKDTTGAWGFWHELGHNHQQRDWTFGGTTEVTCNLFSLYVDEHVRGIRPIEHAWPKDKREKAAAYIRDGSDFAKWKGSPGIALWMYVLVQDEFGWDAFKRVFAEYAALPDAERPKTDDQKRNQWLVRLSRAVGRDLGPYFEAWGVPTSDGARASVADLEPWMPKLVADALAARKGE